ncbi:CPBP family intramembrane glutamic endopeptidase [Streptomyces bullii]|uniref:CPBP family intramembrane glutamic endopeptidase n=1 Tax=Streptomyces bullii TaxID=349910 RepID=A0ABW0UMZ9_9ACTN
MPIVCSVAVLAAVNLLNNWLLRGPVAYVVVCVTATGVLLLLARFDGLTAADLGLDAEGVRRGLRWAPVLAGAVVLVLVLLLAVPAGREVFRDARAVGLSGGHVLGQALVRVPFGTVLLEETAFRGVLWAMIRRRCGTAWATAVSSLLFGLWHLMPARGLNRSNTAVAEVFGGGSAGVVPAVTAAIVLMIAAGAVLCELRRRSGSLLAPAALHWAVNGFSYAFAWAAARWWLDG